jgi:hypothetical protein
MGLPSGGLVEEAALAADLRPLVRFDFIREAGELGFLRRACGREQSCDHGEGAFVVRIIKARNCRLNAASRKAASWSSSAGESIPGISS